MSTKLSIVIPAFNRIEHLRHTLQSVSEACDGLDAQVIIVDDGSEYPLAASLSEFSSLPLLIHRQENQGLVFARNKGLEIATGTFTLFLDSDDLLHRDKLTLQLGAMQEGDLDVSYTDVSRVELSPTFERVSYSEDSKAEIARDAAEFYLKIQPPPHSPMFKTSYLKQHLKVPLIAPNSIYNPIGEVWMYFNLAPYPARIGKVEGPLTIVSTHQAEQLTNHWEKLGIASLALMKGLHEQCKKRDFPEKVRRLLGEAAFLSWRKLPRAFHSRFETELLNIWRGNPKSPSSAYGGRKFQLLSKLLGVESSARVLRYLQRPRYFEIQTIERDELNRLYLEAMGGGQE